MLLTYKEKGDKINMGDFIVLKKFEVSNYKGFSDKLVLDFSNKRDYTFNSKLIKNGLINKAIIYGKNGSGKSNLGLALYDLTSHLTDKEKMNTIYSDNYVNLSSDNSYAKFKYTFLFDKDEIIYEYAKKEIDYLIYEKLTMNDVELLFYNYFPELDNRLGKSNYININNIDTLNIDLPDNKLSILKYIYRNTPTNMSSIITKIIKFAESMLWFRSLSEGNTYIGLRTGSEDMNDIIIKNNKLQDFQLFLHKNGLPYELAEGDEDGKKIILAKYKKRDVKFSTIISSGTRSLWLFYCWMLSFENVSFLFLDEFDAFYHYETAEHIYRNICEFLNCQSIVTTHNTYLMNNSLTRPDCCFIMFDNKEIKPLFACTEKEIREAHNLEKMYRNDAFIN